ncbi:hypothetical protein XpopCFBP1817_11445 [Xanthomonas populi]|uniref:Uncharacterized protein n=1 Tax=Xanthomonas populi TaxID=53414 RepID=A0A2S7ENH3_9XANT|nr:hypothetical protein XpopCFBP1817_11445 [Xanthomonas populi]
MTHKQSILLAIRRHDSSAFLLGACVMTACAVLLLLCLLAEQTLGIDLSSTVAGQIVLALPLLALVLVLWKTGPLACASKPKFPPGRGRKGRTASPVDPGSFEPRSTNEPPRRRPRR